MKLPLIALALSIAPVMFAQLEPPNAAGVTMGHLHVRSRDVAAQRRLWIDVLGGQPGRLVHLDTAKFRGVIVLYEKGEPGGGMEGSIIEHVGFRVHDLKATLAKAEAAGVEVKDRTATGAMLVGPDGLRIEVIGDTAVSAVPVFHHVHFYDKAVNETKAWYVKTFGAKPGKRAEYEAADVPGANLTFSEAEHGATGPTKGRSLDHIGFEVKDLKGFVKKLQASGVHFDVEYKEVPSFGISLAFLTDPYGTYIELTEGLDKL